jgi:hypothetical protein
VSNSLFGHRVDDLNAGRPVADSPRVAKLDWWKLVALNVAVCGIAIRIFEFHRGIVIIFVLNGSLCDELLASVCIQGIVLALNDVKDSLIVITNHLARRILQWNVFVGSIVRQVVESEDTVAVSLCSKNSSDKHEALVKLRSAGTIGILIKSPSKVGRTSIISAIE